MTSLLDTASQMNQIMSIAQKHDIHIVRTSFRTDPFRTCLFVWATGGLSSSSKIFIRTVIPTSLVERSLLTAQVTWTRSSGPGPDVPVLFGPVSLSKFSRLCRDTPSSARLAYSVPVQQEALCWYAHSPRVLC